jgi:hypothetical protein
MKYLILSLVLIGAAFGQNQIPTTLNGVRISNPSNGQCLMYNSTTQKWVNGACQNTVSNLNQITTRLYTDLQSKPSINTNGLLTGGGTLNSSLSIDCPNCANKSGDTYSGHQNFSSSQVSFPLAPLFANLPAASGNTNKIYVITDGNSTCTGGSGTNRCLVTSNGTAWTPYFSGAVINGISDVPGLTSALAGKEPANANIQAHISNTNNPHNVTGAQVGLTSGTVAPTGSCSAGNVYIDSSKMLVYSCSGGAWTALGYYAPDPTVPMDLSSIGISGNPSTPTAGYHCQFDNTLQGGIARGLVCVDSLGNAKRMLSGREIVFGICSGGNCAVNDTITIPRLISSLTSGTLSKCSALAGTGPVGSALSVQIKKNGTTTATVSIADGATLGTTTSFSTATITEGDYLTLTVSAVGSTTSGKDVNIVCVVN